MKQYKIILLIFIYIMFCVSFCSNDNDNDNNGNSGIVYIEITRDNGIKLIEGKEVPFIPNRTVMDYMAMHFDIKTSYGGSFIISINKIESYTASGDSKGYDWFYKVNDKHSEIGSTDYIVNEGDKISWDFRSWDIESITEEYEENQ